MKKQTLYIISFLSCAIACQEADSFLINDEEIIQNTQEQEWRAEQNAWIFTKMKENYFWSEQLKDSSSYDFSLEPSKFFESMLVDEDRFSYCYYNEDYIPETKGQNLNETVSIDTVFKYDGIKDRRIGYFVYDEFKSEADITDIVLKLRRNGIDDLIIDLRNNPGGLVSTGIHLSSLISENTIGELFCTFRFNKRITEKLLKETGSIYEYYYFKNDSATISRNLRMKRVFFLVNNGSASCSELIINCLRPYMKVVTIGETTVGKDVGMRTLSSRRYKYVLQPITFRSYNSCGDSVPQTGIIPDILVKDKNNKIDATLNDPYIKAAIDYIHEIDLLEIKKLG